LCGIVFRQRAILRNQKEAPGIGAINGKAGGPERRAGAASEIAQGLLSKNPREQKASLKKLSKNANALLFVAKNHPEKELREAARKGLYELANKNLDCIPQEGLVLLLTEQKDYYSLWVNMLECLSANPGALKEVVLHPETHKNVALAAVRRISDVKALNMLASHDVAYTRNWEIASAATETLALMVGELTHSKALVRVAMCSMNKNARLTAVRRLNGNADGLRQVLKSTVGVVTDMRTKKTKFPETYVEAAGLLSNMFGDLSDKEALAFLSEEDGMEKVDKEELLNRLGGSGRIAALSKILDSEEHAKFHARAKELLDDAFSGCLQEAMCKE